jgi:hypothetical protein
MMGASRGDAIVGSGVLPDPLLITGFNDYLAPGLALPRNGATAPTLKTFRGNIQAVAFAGSSGIDETWSTIHILHDYVSGTKVYPHVHWSHINASPSGDVKWNIEYSISKGHSGGTFPAATSISLTQTAAAQYTHHIIETSEGDAIAATELEPDTIIMFRIYRDADDVADTFTDDAFLLHFDVHFESDRTFTPEKARPFTKLAR